MTLSPPALLAELLACERAVWDALVAGDAAADMATLDECFLGVYPDGFAGKADHGAQLAAGPTVARYEIAEARVLPLSPDVAVLAYLARYLRPGAEQQEAMYVSSIWRREGGGWRNVFSQDTPATGTSVP
ncbi:MAG: nuclear transport factor 2 family protein [Rhodobacteraceae bacterium]|nr:nuclear transport factor 2 family protein [Paracoccaceae bacterium]